MTRIQAGAAAVLGLLLVLLLIVGVTGGALVNRLDADGLRGPGQFSGTTPPGLGQWHTDPDRGYDTAPGETEPDTSTEHEPGTGPDPSVFDHGEASPGVFTAAPGDCFVTSDDTRTVPCDHPHGAEVFYTFTMDGDDYPGEDGFDLDRCTEMFGPYVGTTHDASGYGIAWLVPSRSTWEQSGDREVICMLVTEDLRTGSAYQSIRLVV